MKKIFPCLAVLCFSSLSFSAHFVDIYGAQKRHADQILREFTKQVIGIESGLAKEDTHFLISNKENIKKTGEIREKKNKLAEKIKKNGMFLYVAFHTTTYQNTKDLYTTIEVIEKNSPERMKFLDTNIKTKQYPNQTDLIEKMRAYDDLGWKLSELKQLDPINIPCPAFHCIFGFNHPKLKPYLSIFNQGVIQEKIKILNVLRFDPDPERRAAAAFLIGHLKNPKEIISILSKHVQDKNSLVRNNVLRVMAFTIEKAQITHINVDPFLSLLTSPYGTDRNKALAILVETTSNDTAKMRIINKAGKNLLQLLQMKQPNNHELAYSLLKRISGKQYGEHDLTSWTKWVQTAK